MKTNNKYRLSFSFVVTVYLVAMFLEQQWLLLIFKFKFIVATLLFYFLNVTGNMFVV